MATDPTGLNNSTLINSDPQHYSSKLCTSVWHFKNKRHQNDWFHTNQMISHPPNKIWEKQKNTWCCWWKCRTLKWDFHQTEVQSVYLSLSWRSCSNEGPCGAHRRRHSQGYVIAIHRRRHSRGNVIAISRGGRRGAVILTVGSIVVMMMFMAEPHEPKNYSTHHYKHNDEQAQFADLAHVTHCALLFSCLNKPYTFPSQGQVPFKSRIRVPIIPWLLEQTLPFPFPRSGALQSKDQDTNNSMDTQMQIKWFPPHRQLQLVSSDLSVTFHHDYWKIHWGKWKKIQLMCIVFCPNAVPHITRGIQLLAIINIGFSTC